ncbi:MAG: 23S rRNA (guanosine(2251)-2'-O)-methyltransferase RlmB [Metamycoplasmataceae bacterium]
MDKNFIFGKNTVLNAINNNEEIEEIFLSKNNFIKTNIKKTILSNKELDEMVNGNHQGYIALVKEFVYYQEAKLFKDKPPIILVLDHIEDPQNLGAIIRTANCLGIDNVIIPNKRSATINSTVTKVASGGLVGFKVVQTSSLSSFIIKAKEKGYWVYGTSLNEKAKSINKAPFNFPLVLIVGNEGKGISKTNEKLSDELVYLEMKGNVQSLNVSVATGIFLYEILKKGE